MGIPIEELLASGEKARLIPTVAKSKHEERATSVLLAMFRVVPQFAKTMLSEVGAPSNARASVQCYTEVVFKQKGSSSKQRPDGLIIVTYGNNVWTALVESKVGSTELTVEQCESYLDLARDLNIDAVITISNQFASVPSHHPVSVSKIKTRKVGFYHFSWLSLMSKAILISEDSAMDDPEQAFLMRELIRFLRHDSSGLAEYKNMGADWKAIADDVHQGAVTRIGDSRISSTVSSWHQLCRFLSIDLTIALAKPVSVYLSRTQQNDSEKRLKDDIDDLLKHKQLSAEFDIPNAASKLKIMADFRRRAIILQMDVQAPQDKTRATAAVNWLTKQIKETAPTDALLRVIWPNRIPDTQLALTDAIETPERLIPEGFKGIPKSIQVVQVIDLAGKFKTATGVIEATRKALPAFYGKVLQKVRPWSPEAPKIKSSANRHEESLPEVIGNELEAENVTDLGKNVIPTDSDT